MTRAAVVTGVSTGIGRAIAQALIDAGWQVFGSVRSEADAERLKAAFGEGFVPLRFDVTDVAAVRLAAAEVRLALGGQRLAALVNNAGIAVAGPLLDIAPQDFRRQLDVNLTGPVIVAQAFAPLLGTDPALAGEPGRIVNISSVGGRVAFPFMAPYHASKFGLEGLSESLRRELLLFGIDVVVVAPGGVRTPIWDKAEAVDVSPWKGTAYEGPLAKIRTIMMENGRTGLAPDVVGRTVLHALTVKRPRLRYALAKSRLEALVMARIPKRWFDRLVAGQLGLRRRR